MDWGAISALAEVSGVIIVVVTLIFLAIQIRQSNRLGKAEAERDWFGKWHDLVQAPAKDFDAATAFRNGLNHYNSLEKSERAVFSGHLVALLDHAQSAHRLNLKGYLDDDLLVKIMNTCIGYIKTPGGAQWWSEVGPYMGVYQYLEALPRDNIPAYTEVISYFEED